METAQGLGPGTERPRVFIIDVENITEIAKITVVYDHSGWMCGAVRAHVVSRQHVFLENKRFELTRVKIPKSELYKYTKQITAAQAKQLHLFHIQVLSGF